MRPRAWLTAAIVVVAVASVGGLFHVVRSGDRSPQPPPDQVAAQSSAVAITFRGVGGRGFCRPPEYGGPGEPQVAVALDTTFHGSWPGEESVAAVRLLLEERGWRAGKFRVALLVCESYESPYGKFTNGSCSRNARLYASNPAILAVVGPASSGCAATQIPMVGEPNLGPVAIVSGTNTYVCLTRHVPGCAPEEPRKYYPSARRHYARVVSHDVTEAAALAQLAHDQSLRRVVVLWDYEAYGFGIAYAFRGAAASLGLSVVGFTTWNPRAPGYRRLMKRVRQKRPDAVLLAGLIDENGAQVMRDKIAVLGRNDGRVKLLAPQGFLTPRTLRKAGRAAEGLLLTNAGLALSQLPDRGRAFARAVRARTATTPGARDLTRAVYTAQAAEVVLDAIARSDGSRERVLDELTKTRITDGLIGEVAFDEHGDTTSPSISIYTVDGRRFRLTDALSPHPALIDAALNR